MQKVRIRKVSHPDFWELWVLEVYSPIVNDWIVQGEHLSKLEAERDLKMWQSQ